MADTPMRIQDSRGKKAGHGCARLYGPASGPDRTAPDRTQSNAGCSGVSLRGLRLQVAEAVGVAGLVRRIRNVGFLRRPAFAVAHATGRTPPCHGPCAGAPGTRRTPSARLSAASASRRGIHQMPHCRSSRQTGLGDTAFPNPFPAPVLPASHSSTPYHIKQKSEADGPEDNEAEDHEYDPGRFAVIVYPCRQIHLIELYINIFYIYILEKQCSPVKG